MHIDNLDVLVPMIDGSSFSEAEALGGAVWLWMQSESHRDAPLHMLSTLLLPAIKTRQFILASENGKPVFYLAWARLNEEAEHRYLHNPPQCMPESDWTSGERIWFLDWVAPFGHSWALRDILKRRVFPGQCGRSLYHRGNEKGLRVVSFHGIAVTPEEARFWFEHNPPAFELLSGSTK